MSEERQRRRNERIMRMDECIAHARAMLQNGKVVETVRELDFVLEQLHDIARLDAQEAQCAPR